MQKDQEFLEYVIKALVDNPGEVKVTRTVDEMGVLMTLSVAAADMGKIIGRDGNTAKSIRTLLRTVGMKNNSRVNLKINEPEGGLRFQPEAGNGRVEKASKTVDEAMADLKI
ncbi:MAG: KH domain-containing protein [Patescibacteria group bacterium]|nr:KH domain-containing protein [Patescibacteria group bacterium]